VADECPWHIRSAVSSMMSATVVTRIWARRPDSKQAYGSRVSSSRIREASSRQGTGAENLIVASCQGSTLRGHPLLGLAAMIAASPAASACAIQAAGVQRADNVGPVIRGDQSDLRRTIGHPHDSDTCCLTSHSKPQISSPAWRPKTT
jgi:hypothetical protein